MKYAEKLIRLARERKASDLHLVAGLPPALRVNGDIAMVKSESLSREEIRKAVLELLTPEQIRQLEKEKELCFSVFDSEAGRIRVTVYYHAGIPELAVRLCALEISDSAALGLPPIIDEWARKPNGLVLVTGPTGAGKTTTLNYAVDLINREMRRKIVMIEDPVEFVHRPNRSIVVQQEVYTDVLSYPRALLHVLRQNPDVIVIGEMRELQTIETALTAAETGHLVLATLHTPNTAQTVERITSVFTGEHQLQIRYQLASCLQGVITQSLIPRADGKGRVLACEILVATAAVRNIIRENGGQKLYNVVSTGRKEGMISMDQSLEALYQKGIITYDAAISRALDPKSIARAAKGGAEP